jgi:hypothetical protein
MKTTLQSSSGMKVRVREYEDADINQLVAAGRLPELTAIINAYQRQKSALVDFRTDFSTRIGALGFSRLTVTSPVGDTVSSETHGDHIKRFREALLNGSNYQPTGFTPVLGDTKAKEAHADAYMQSIASLCGDSQDENGNPCYTLDIVRAPRSGNSGLIPKFWMDSATKIIANGSAGKWAGMFANGFTSPRGIAIDKVEHEDFCVAAEHHSTPEQKEAIHQTNIKRLARGLMAYDKQEKGKMQGEFV